MREDSEHERSEKAFAARACDVPFDLWACGLDETVVLHAGRACGDARHTSETAIDVGNHRARHLRALTQSALHEHDPTTRRVHFLPPQDVRGACGQAEAAMDAVVDQLRRGRSMGVERSNWSGHSESSHVDSRVTDPIRIET